MTPNQIARDSGGVNASASKSNGAPTMTPAPAVQQEPAQEWRVKGEQLIRIAALSAEIAALANDSDKDAEEPDTQRINDRADKAMKEAVAHLAAAPVQAVEPVRMTDAARELPAWQDVLCDAEMLVREKPTWSRFIKGTPLENDVPVWIADYALRMLQRDRAGRTIPKE